MEDAQSFVQLVLILGGATLAAIVAQLLRQPLVVAFIGFGLLAGPAGLGLVEINETFELFGRMGVSLLLFVVGLRLDPSLIRTAGPVALVSGVGQVVITAVVGYGVALLLGIPPVPALYVSLALTFSSTVIVVKVLSDRREIDSLHGRIALGILIVQDLMVIMALTVLAALGGVTNAEDVVVDLGLIALRGLGLVVALVVVARFIAPVLEGRLASSPEALVLAGIAWAIALAVAAQWAGFSVEMGAFLAGISLAGRPPRQLVAARLTSLRDFLLLFFFVSLGAQVDFQELRQQVTPALLLSLFVLIGNPLIVLLIMVSMRFRARTGFLAGAALAQISEFSFVLMAMGITLGHVTESDLALVTLVGIVTFGVSTYLIIYSSSVYARLQPLLRRLERHVPHLEEEDGGSTGHPSGRLPEVLVFGVGRMGTVLLSRLREAGIDAQGVDFDPVTVRRLRQAGLDVRLGDAEDPEFVGTLPLAAVRLAVCTVPSRDIQVTLAHALRSHRYLGPVIMTSATAADALYLTGHGAALVLLPYEAAGDRASEVIRRTLRDPSYLERVKLEPHPPVIEEPVER